MINYLTFRLKFLQIFHEYLVRIRIINSELRIDSDPEGQIITDPPDPDIQH
jgi:hypothetical protein